MGQKGQLSPEHPLKSRRYVYSVGFLVFNYLTCSALQISSQ